MIESRSLSNEEDILLILKSLWLGDGMRMGIPEEKTNTNSIELKS
jgi:hypothetical protein